METFDRSCWDEEIVLSGENAETGSFSYRDDYSLEENDELDQPEDDGNSDDSLPTCQNAEVCGQDGGDEHLSEDNVHVSQPNVVSQSALVGSRPLQPLSGEQAEESPIPTRVFLGKTRSGKDVFQPPCRKACLLHLAEMRT